MALLNSEIDISSVSSSRRAPSKLRVKTGGLSKFVFHSKELRVWNDYRTLSTGALKSAALARLLEFHDVMLQCVARKVYSKHSHMKCNELEDFVQESKIAAILAYETYVPQISTPTDQQFRNYIYGRVLGSLKTFAMGSFLIKYPRHAIAWRNYFNGAYDSNPSRKADFELAHDLTTEAARRDAKMRYGNIIFHTVQSECDLLGGWENVVTHSEEDFGDDSNFRLDLDEALEEATKDDYKPARSREVFRMICELEMSISDVQEALGLSRSVVRELIHETRVKIRRVLLARNSDI